MKKIDLFKAILKSSNITGVDFAARIGLSYNSYRTMTATSAKNTPKWVIAVIETWKMAHDPELMCIECHVNENGHGEGYLFCKDCSNN